MKVFRPADANDARDWARGQVHILTSRLEDGHPVDEDFIAGCWLILGCAGFRLWRMGVALTTSSLATGAQAVMEEMAATDFQGSAP